MADLDAAVKLYRNAAANTAVASGGEAVTSSQDIATRDSQSRDDDVIDDDGSGGEGGGGGGGLPGVPAALCRRTERRVATGEEMAAARDALGAVPAFAPLCAADPRRAAALAAACRIRVHFPGEVVISGGWRRGSGGRSPDRCSPPRAASRGSTCR